MIKPARFRLHDPELLRRLMLRTGDGSKTTVRELAQVAGVHHSLVGELLSGAQETASVEVASGVASRIGVDLLVLWTPAERADSAMATRLRKAS